MAGSSRLLQAFYRLYFGFWIPTLVWASTWWPLQLMYWMCRRLVMLPFNLRHLGQDAYGLWMLVGSVTIHFSVRLLLRVLKPRVGWPHGVTG